MAASDAFKVDSFRRFSMLSADLIQWRGRDAARIANGLIELIALKDGGHFAEFRFHEKSGRLALNMLWDAPWMSFEPGPRPKEELAQTAGLTGHGLCFDYFGAPSGKEAELGFPPHGEAASQRWNVQPQSDPMSAACRWEVRLPNAQLHFERTTNLHDDETVVSVEETASSEQDVDHACHWVQHATFSPPFVSAADSSFAVSGMRGLTAPEPYEGGSLLSSNEEFLWPHAPGSDGDGCMVDLGKPFSAMGRGCLAAIQLDPGRDIEFIVAMNWKLKLGMGYCFRSKDFPWMAIWEENCARADAPWNGKTRARGMEFGTTPFPLGREETFRRGLLFDTPAWCVIPARGKRVARYLLFAFAIPGHIHSIENVQVNQDSIVFHGDSGDSSFSIPAQGCGEFLSEPESFAIDRAGVTQQHP